MINTYLTINPNKNLLLVVLLPLFFILIVFTQYYYDSQKRQRPLIEPSIIPAQAIKITDLGLHSFASSFMWLYTIQKMSETFTKLPMLIKTVNELDPKFSYPYAFSALILPAFGFDKEAIEIAKRGIESADTNWRIPYYLATTYHIFFQDRENAAFYFDLAAITPGADEVAKKIASQYGLGKTVREQTKDIWQSIYETSGDEIVRERAQSYIIHIEILELLEKAMTAYRQRLGFEPQKIEDLVTAGIIKNIPKSPLGVSFYIENSRIFTQ